MRQQRYQLNKTKYLVEPEHDRLCYILDSFIDQDQRNCVLIYLALLTGGRATELLNIRLEDVNEYDESLYIRGIKGSDDREIPLPSWLFKHVLQLKGSLDPQKCSGLMFPISYSRLVQVWHLYRPVHKKFHSLRHTFAIRLYKKTKDLRLLQVALGHRNVTNTMIYADYLYSQTELRRLIL